MKDFKEYKRGKYTIMEWEDGEKWWLFNRVFHREDGPAKVEYSNGPKEWWLDGKVYSEKSWKKEMRKRKLKALGI